LRTSQYDKSALTIKYAFKFIFPAAAFTVLPTYYSTGFKDWKELSFSFEKLMVKLATILKVI
jgi:hypothetical protein